MKIHYGKTILYLLLLCIFSVAKAQDRKLERAKEGYDHLHYIDAREVYLAVAKKGYESEELFTKLGNTYYFNAEYDDAAHWYEKLFTLAPQPEDPVLYLRYSQSLKATGKTEKAKEYFDLYRSKSGISDDLMAAVDYLDLVRQNSGRYHIKTLDRVYDDKKISFGHTIYDNHLIYATSEGTPSFRNTVSSWDGLHFLSLYEVPLNEEFQASGKPRKFKGSRSKFHESSAVFTKDGNTMYFPGNADKKRDRHLKIYRSKKVDGKWQDPEELHF